jgi:DNA-binding transcriptional MocR family regulator
LHKKAFDAKISTVPGSVLSAKQRYPNFIRLSYGHPWSVELEQALAMLGRLARER